MRSRWFGSALIVIATMQSAAAQGTSGQSRELQLATAQKALAAGEAAQALRIAEQQLTRAPRDREFTEIAIQSYLALDHSHPAYSTYDRYVLATRADDAVLLKPIATRELQSIAQAAVHDPRLKADVLERLARHGDTKAAAELRQAVAAPGRGGLLADAALARLGDVDAMSRLAAKASAPDFADKPGVAEAIRLSGDTSHAALLVELLRHPDPRTRIDAVEALAALRYTAALPQMRELLSDSMGQVRARAALALTRLGDPSGRQMVDAMLRSPVADVRLRALDADPSVAEPVRREMIRDVLDDPEPLNRVKAAEALARDEPAAAKPVLESLLQDPDFLPRREAGRVIETLKPPDVALYRRLMSDADPWVRMYGASGVLTAAAARTQKPR